MGIDLLDIHFRLERSLGFKLELSGLEAAMKARGVSIALDLIVQDFLDWSLTAFNHGISRRTHWISDDLACANCRLSLRDVPVPGYCRHCGMAITAEQFVWRILVETLVDSLGINPDKVRRESFLVKELGASF